MTMEDWNEAFVANLCDFKLGHKHFYAVDFRTDTKIHVSLLSTDCSRRAR